MVPGTGEFDLQAARAFDNLYATNTHRIADAFAHAWAVMAAAFRGNPMMLGYDLFNEPNPGSQWQRCANPAGRPVFDLTTLEPLEDKLAAAVRSVDPTAIAFYEPHIYFDSGVPSWLKAPPSTSGPSGFAFHDYCLSAALTGQPDHESQSSGYPACPPIDQWMFTNAERTATLMGVPPLFDEFRDTQDLAHIQRVIDLADSHLTGWIYWSYNDWVDDPGGLGSGPLFEESDDNGTLRQAKRAVLSQPYPVATAGIPQAERYDSTSDTFTYSYTPDRRISAPTVIFTAPLHYPKGYTVTVSGARLLSAPDARYLELQPDGHGDLVYVRLAPAGGSSSAARAASRARIATACDATCESAFSPLLAAGLTSHTLVSVRATELGTASGTCDTNADDPTVVHSPTLDVVPRDVIAQVHTTRGAGEITAPNGISVAYGAGDTAWADLGPVAGGGVAKATIICRSGPASYDFTFGEAPQLPASFSGSSSHDINVSLASSRLAFQVSARGHYVANVHVTAGTIEVGLRRPDGTTPPAISFSGPGTEDLGTLEPGEASIDVTAQPGVQAQWTISIHALNTPSSTAA